MEHIIAIIGVVLTAIAVVLAAIALLFGDRLLLRFWQSLRKAPAREPVTTGIRSEAVQQPASFRMQEPVSDDAFRQGFQECVEEVRKRKELHEGINLAGTKEIIDEIRERKASQLD